MVGDARMAHATGKEVGHSEQILRHKPAIRGTYAANTPLIDKWMQAAHGLHALNDIFSHAPASRIHMAATIPLTVADGSTRIHHIDHITQRGKERMRILRLEIA